MIDLSHVEWLSNRFGGSERFPRLEEVEDMDKRGGILLKIYDHFNEEGEVIFFKVTA